MKRPILTYGYDLTYYERDTVLSGDGKTLAVVSLLSLFHYF